MTDEDRVRVVRESRQFLVEGEATVKVGRGIDLLGGAAFDIPDHTAGFGRGVAAPIEAFEVLDPIGGWRREREAREGYAANEMHAVVIEEMQTSGARVVMKSLGGAGPVVVAKNAGDVEAGIAFPGVDARDENGVDVGDLGRDGIVDIAVDEEVAAKDDQFGALRGNEACKLIVERLASVQIAGEAQFHAVLKNASLKPRVIGDPCRSRRKPNVTRASRDGRLVDGIFEQAVKVVESLGGEVEGALGVLKGGRLVVGPSALKTNGVVA